MSRPSGCTFLEAKATHLKAKIDSKDSVEEMAIKDTGVRTSFRTHSGQNVAIVKSL